MAKYAYEIRKTLTLDFMDQSKVSFDCATIKKSILKLLLLLGFIGPLPYFTLILINTEAFL